MNQAVMFRYKHLSRDMYINLSNLKCVYLQSKDIAVFRSMDGEHSAWLTYVEMSNLIKLLDGMVG